MGTPNEFQHIKNELLFIRRRLRNLEKYVPLIDEMIEQHKMDKAIADAVRKHNRVYLSRLQKLGAGIVVALTIAQALHDIFG